MNDALIAAQNAVVAAQSYGIGSCYIGDIMENIELHRDLLGLPDYVFPAALLVFGYPTEQQKERKKPERFAMEHIVFENRYPHIEEEKLLEMMKNKSGKEDPVSWLRAFCRRKYNSDFARELTRSVGKYLEQFKE